MQQQKKGFTLIEFIIVITISALLVTLTFANYGYFQNIAKVKLAAKEISQSISESRNSAIAGYQKDGVNQKMGVLFSKDTNVIEYYSFDYASGTLLSDRNKIKEKNLPEGIRIVSDGVLLVFSSLFGEGTMYDQEGNQIDDVYANIDIQYKESTAPRFQQTIQYIQSTNMIDY